MARAGWLATIVLCTLLPFVGQFYGDRGAGWLAIDFRAYYCAALAQREHRNPYFAQSIHDCERTTPAPFYRVPENVSVPAPYPPYALAFMYPITLLPFAAAVYLWWALLAASLLIAAAALARAAAAPALVAWGALALSLGLTSLTSGNVIPLAVAAIVVAALLAQRGKLAAASLALAFAMIEPQIALPASVGFFALAPRGRPYLIATFAALLLVALATAGFAQTLGYGTLVLPAHALSEVSRDNQYSLSTVLAALGVSDRAAVTAGSVSYIVALVAGVVLALRLARQYDDPALAVLVPPAVSLLGGTFVHTGEIAIAAPACLVLLMRAAPQRAWLLGTLILLAVPWMLSTSAALFLAPIFPAAYLAYALRHRDRRMALAVALGAFAVIFGLFELAIGGGHASHIVREHPPIDPRLAEAGWRQLVLGNTTNSLVMWLLRLPTWIGLIAFAALAAAVARGSAAHPSPDRRLLESRA